jgi:hypothetical protein
MALLLTAFPVIGPSRIPLPAPLRSTPITALRRYYERSDSCVAGSSARREHEHRLAHTGLPSSRTHCHDHSVATHLMSPHRRFITLPLSAMRAPPFRVRLHQSQQARRDIRPYRVRPPTDWSRAVDCSPRRVTAPQLSLASRPESGCLGKDLHLPRGVRSKAHWPPAPFGAGRAPRGLDREDSAITSATRAERRS